MSLLNAWILPEEAIVAVDTDGVAQDGARMPSSKLLPIPHLNAVMALRGQLAMLSYLFTRCLSASFDSFDELCDAMPALLGDASAEIPGELIVASPISGFELVVAGYSERNSQMAARLYVERGDMAERLVRDIDRFVSPWHESMPAIPKVPHALEKIARAQVRWMRGAFPDAACGGRLLVCNLTRRSMRLNHSINFQRQE